MTGRINNLPLYVHFHNADYKYENLLDIVLLNYRSLHQYLSSASLLYVFEFLFSLICTSSKRCRKFSFSILYVGFLPVTLQDVVLILPTVCINVNLLFHTRNRCKNIFFSTSTHLINLWFDSKRPLYSLTHLTYILLSVPCLLVPLELIFLKYLIR